MNAVTLRDGFHGDASVVVNRRMLCGVDGMEHHRVGESFAKEIYLSVEQGFKLGCCVDV